MTATAARVTQRAASVGAGRGGPGRAYREVQRQPPSAGSCVAVSHGAIPDRGLLERRETEGSIPGCQRTTERRKVARQAASTYTCALPCHADTASATTTTTSSTTATATAVSLCARQPRLITRCNET